MTSLYGSLARRSAGTDITLDQLLSFKFNNLWYQTQLQQTLGSKTDEIGADFHGLVDGAYRSNGVVFACMMVRQLLFQEARFQYRRFKSGRPGEYFGTRDLLPLERPWTNATTGDLLARAIQDVDLAGNWYGARIGDGIRRLRPDAVTIMMASRHDAAHAALAPDVEIVGYAYKPAGGRPAYYLPEEVAHFAPYPDPIANFRGMSWLTPVIREIMGDQAATTHKLKYFEQGASPNLIVTFDPAISNERVQEWIKLMEERIGGAANAYATLYLGGGADARPVGANLRDVDFKNVMAGGETRLAAAAGVPPIIVGLSEGLASATYSNYGQARRRFADATLRPLWRNFAGSVASIIRVPNGAELWYDDRDIPFLAEDLKDAAETQFVDSQSVKQLIEAGFEPGSVIDAVTAGDLARLSHTGLVSIQLQEPGGPPPAAVTPPARQLEARNKVAAETPPGEADIRAIAERFVEVEQQIRGLLAEALNGNREALLGQALEALDTLRAERASEAVLTAYAAAYDTAVSALEAKAASTDPVGPLADSLDSKLDAAITVAEDHAPDAFRNATDENLEQASQDAVTAHVDEAGRQRALGSYASMLTFAHGRRATSRGIKDACARVQFSTHGTTHPACKALEGQEFPAASAPEPPIHAGCQHTLIPIA